MRLRALSKSLREDTMEFSIKSGNSEKQKSGCVVVGIYDGRKLSPAAQSLDAASRRYV